MQLKRRVAMVRILLLVLLTIFVSHKAVAQDTNGDGVVHVLLPIAFSEHHVISGAYGTQWKVEIWVANKSDVGLTTLQGGGECDPAGCSIVVPAQSVAKYLTIMTNQGVSGALFTISPSISPKVDYSVRLLELSRRAQPTGVDLPVVREDDFLSTQTVLSAVPVGPSIRSSLRVYDPRLKKATAVKVDFIGPTGAILRSTRLAPGADPSVPVNPNLNHPTPGYDAIDDLTTAFPELKTVPYFHVRLTPEGTGTEYWGFVSVTDNDSQHVLLITPK